MAGIKLNIRKRASQITTWVKINRKEATILGIILIIGTFFRLYKIADYMTFLGDEGRDAIIVRRLLVDFDPILIGPRTSIGDMYLGPLYYYLMAPALLLANFSPIGPSNMVALFGVATIFLAWHVTREWIFKNSDHSKGSEPCVGALIAAFLYSISPVVITYSKSSWNPNIMPFFALLSIYGIWKVWNQQKYKWLIVIGNSMAFVLQSHYLGLLLIPTLGLFWFLTFFKILKSQRSKVKGQRLDFSIFLKYSFWGISLFTVMMSPLVIFDSRHGWRNLASMKKFFVERQTTVSARPWTALPKIWPIFKYNFIARLITGTTEDTNFIKWTSVFITAGFVWLVISALYRGLVSKRKKKDQALFLLSIWLIVGLIGFGIYKQHVYDHYFGFMFPVPFILIGMIAEKVYTLKSDGIKIFFTTGLLLLTIVNLKKNPLWFEPNHQMRRAIDVASLIQKNVGQEKFNLAVIAERNYEDGYQYFLEKEGTNVIDIDPLQAEETTADQLFVVCELPEKQCDPTHNSKAEVANFGWSVIEDKWKINEITIYKLVHRE